MSLQLLNIDHFRNIRHFSGEFSSNFNIIAGENGSGKTSLLEAIYFMGRAKSFRTHLSNQLITHHLDAFILFAKVLNESELISIGIKRQHRVATQIKLNGQHCQSAAELASMLPILVLNPDSYKILESGPKYRRQCLDWGLFHVEQRFFPIWKRFQRALNQRNSALKAQRATSEVAAWDFELANSAEQINTFRQDYFNQLSHVLAELLVSHDILRHIHCDYVKGWPEDHDLLTLLSQNLPRDRQLGYTAIGPQRADIKFSIEGYPVENVLSRGQQKILVSFLCLAQGMLCHQLQNKPCLYLVDDLPSELDEHHKHFLLDKLAALKSQVFVTGVNEGELHALVANFPHQMFHVEHGQITCP